MSGRIIVDAGWDGVLKRLDSEEAPSNLSRHIVLAFQRRKRLLKALDPICPICGSETEWTSWVYMIRDLCWRTSLACRKCSRRHYECLIAGALSQYLQDDAQAK